ARLRRPCAVHAAERRHVDRRALRGRDPRHSVCCECERWHEDQHQRKKPAARSPHSTRSPRMSAAHPSPTSRRRRSTCSGSTTSSDLRRASLGFKSVRVAGAGSISFMSDHYRETWKLKQEAPGTLLLENHHHALEAARPAQLPDDYPAPAARPRG